MTDHPSADNTLLRFDHWTISFPDGTVAVDDLSFSLRKGERLGIVGESGSGKSMTALSVMQLLPTTACSRGQVWWEGQDNLAELSEKELTQLRGRRIAMVFQEPLSSLNPTMRCGAQINEVLITHLSLNSTEAKTRTLSWLKKVELNEPERVYQAYPHQLSGGQRQRVMIAMALCAEPDLLIADEPTTALDATVQRSVLDLIRRLCDEMNLSVLFISHDLGVIRHITERVLVMQHGKLIESGEVGSVFSRPTQPYTLGLVQCRPALNHHLERLPTVEGFLELDTAQQASFLTSLRKAEGAEQTRISHLAEQPEVLRVDKLSVSYSGTRNWWGKRRAATLAVQAVDLTLRQGECLGIVGESGSGKTTLGKAILRLVPASGRVTYAGQDVLALSEAAFRPLRPRLQMVFQDPFSSLNPSFTIRQTLAEPLMIFQPELDATAREERLQAILAQVHLPSEVLDRKPHAFSGGQRQRIGIARALLLQPEVLICDESVSALDVSVQARVLNLLKDLQAKYGFALIFISHDLSVIQFMADRTLVMQKGRVVEQGETRALFAKPQEAYTQRLLNSML